MNKPIISIIVPVYNSEKYIQRCINSIINQTFINFEVIFVNDGSIDNSLEILNSNKSLDSRIKIINQENFGTGEARNNGLRNALGEYILFVDSDDTIESLMLEEMYKKALEENSDIVICEINRVLSDGKKVRDNIYNNINKNNIFSSILSFSIRSSVWDKLYKKELFIKNNIFFPEKTYDEDNGIVFKLIFFAKHISFIDKYLYNWYIIENSKSNSVSKDRIKSISNILVERYNFLIEYKIYDTYEIAFIKSMFTLINTRINNIIYFNASYLIEYIENLIVRLPYFTKDNIIIAKQYIGDIYFKFLNTIILSNSKSILLNCFPKNDIYAMKYYLKQDNGLLQSIIDNLEFFSQRNIYIYGTGENFVRLNPYLNDYNIIGVLDKNPSQDIQDNYSIVKLDDISSSEDVTIVITSVAFVFEIKYLIEEYLKKSKERVNIIHCYNFIDTIYV